MDELLKKLSDHLSSHAGELSWKVDTRFNAATATIQMAISKDIQNLLEDSFPRKWTVEESEPNSEIMEKVVGSVGGPGPGQILYTSDESSQPIVYCAWWPWGNGNNISLRIGVFDESYSANQSIDAIRPYFKF